MKALKAFHVLCAPSSREGSAARQGKAAAVSVVRYLSTGNLSLHNGKYETSEDVQRKKRDLLKHDWSIPKTV